MNVTDPRIGVRDETGKTTKMPTQYVTGAFWARGANPTPTQQNLDGNKGRLFVFLPIRMLEIPEKTLPELRKAAGLPALEPVVTAEEAAAAKAKASDVETPEDASRVTSKPEPKPKSAFNQPIQPGTDTKETDKKDAG